MQKYTTATVYYASSTTATTECFWVESDSTEATTVVFASDFCYPQGPPAEEVAAEKTEEACEEEQAVAEFIPPRELMTAYRRRPLQLPSSYG